MIIIIINLEYQPVILLELELERAKVFKIMLYYQIQNIIFTIIAFGNLAITIHNYHATQYLKKNVFF